MKRGKKDLCASLLIDHKSSKKSKILPLKKKGEEEEKTFSSETFVKKKRISLPTSLVRGEERATSLLEGKEKEEK